MFLCGLFKKCAMYVAILMYLETKIVSILLFRLVTIKTSILVTSKLFRGMLFQTAVCIILLN